MEIIFDRNVLDSEIALIKDESLRQWTKETLLNGPEYYFTGMASSTGKYHPRCTIRKGGLIIHVKRVVYLANRLADGWKIEGRNRDLLIASAIVHDIAKTDYKTSTYQEYEDHPINAQKYFAKSKWVEKDDTTYEQLVDIVKYHMGPWTPKSVLKPLSKYKPLELAMYTADYFAATKDMGLPVDGIEEYVFKSGLLEPIK